MKFRVLKVSTYDSRGYKRVYLPRDWDRKYGNIQFLICVEEDKYIIVVPLTEEKAKLILKGIPIKKILSELLEGFIYV